LICTVQMLCCAELQGCTYCKEWLRVCAATLISTAVVGLQPVYC
jgi:hypothetical protein